MPRTITVIPATINPITRMPGKATGKRKVAAYARVSTDKEEQENSFEAQVDYYTDTIKANPNWEYVDIYADEGISGTNTKQRDGFKRMINDALAGKIDLILTKSISRFARNTIDSLTNIRKLKEIGCEVFFEKENIWTFDSSGEVLITIMSSIAQEESRSISENVTWGQRKRFQDGKITLPYKHFLGYERGANKDAPPVVNPEQAVIIRKIYSLFIHGKTPGGIARQLTQEHIPTPSGKEIWRTSTIESILTNEKYRGSARLQKKFTTDFLTKTMKKNEGEVPQYYIEESHEAIIDPVEWDIVQEEIQRRKQIGKAYSGKSVFGSKIVCAECGGFYGSKTWHSTDKYKTIIWQCNSKFDKKCSTPHLTEEDIKKRFLQVYNSMIANKKEIVAACNEAISVVTDTTKIDEEISELLQEIEIVTELTKKYVEQNSSMAQDQNAYAEKYNSYVARYEKAKARYDSLLELKNTRLSKGNAINRFMRDISKRDTFLTEFDDLLWLMVIEKAVVQKNGNIRFCFHDGSEIEG